MRMLGIFAPSRWNIWLCVTTHHALWLVETAQSSMTDLRSLKSPKSNWWFVPCKFCTVSKLCLLCHNGFCFGKNHQLDFELITLLRSVMHDCVVATSQSACCVVKHGNVFHLTSVKISSILTRLKDHWSKVWSFKWFEECSFNCCVHNVKLGSFQLNSTKGCCPYISD